MTADEFFDTQRDRMVRRGDWTRAAELNLLPSSEVSRPFQVLLVRLSTYEDTCLSITHHYLYALLASLGHYPDRAFLPPARDEELWEAHGIGWLTGVQSRLPGRDFGLIAFSNSVAQEMGNLLWFLKTSGFPLQARERLDREDLPLVVMGGANAPFSSLFWGDDSPLDGVFLGEHRSSMEALFRTVAEGRAAGKTKRQIRDDLAAVPGFLVPGRADPVKVLPSRETLDPELLAAMPVALGEGNAGKAHLAISGGCAGFCSFCAESWTRKPYTEGEGGALAAAALRVKAGQGASRLDLFSFNFNMHADLYPLMESVAPWVSALGLKSQRFDSIAADPLLLDLEKLFGKTWFTCGLEGISDRLRRALNKNLDNTQLRRAFAVFARSGVRELKAFLIATGWEEEEDYEEFGRLLTHLKTLPGPSGRGLNVVFSVTPLVRFPHTPLEFEPAPDPRETDRAVRRILRTAKEHGFEGRAAAPADEAAVCDLMLRPPSAQVYGPWAATVLEGRFVYRDEIPNWFVRHWKDRLTAAGWDEERLKGAYGAEQNRSAPWARVETGVSRAFLEAQHRRVRSFRELVPAGLIRPASADQNLVRRWTEAWKARAASEVVVEVVFRVNGRAVAAGRDQTAASLARALMLEDQALARGYRGFRGTLWSEGAAFCPLEGEDRFRLALLPEAATVLRAWDEVRWRSAAVRCADFGDLPDQAGLPPPPAGRWKVTVRSPWPLDGQKLLTARGLKHTLRRQGTEGWVFDFPPAVLKKDWVRGLTGRQSAGGWEYELLPGSKWEPRTVLEEGFAYPPDGGPSRVSLSASFEPLPPR